MTSPAAARPRGATPIGGDLRGGHREGEHSQGGSLSERQCREISLSSEQIFRRAAEAIRTVWKLPNPQPTSIPNPRRHFYSGRWRRRIRQPVGTAGEQPAWMTKNTPPVAALRRRWRRRARACRGEPCPRPGHGGEPDTAADRPRDPGRGVRPSVGCGRRGRRPNRRRRLSPRPCR